MIPIDPEFGFVIYVGIWFAIFAIMWGIELWRVKVYDWDLSKDRICACERCHYTFFMKNHENITRCPNCNELCIVKKNKKL